MIHGEILFKKAGKYWTSKKSFNDTKHMDNYIAAMARAGWKELGSDWKHDGNGSADPKERALELEKIKQADAQTITDLKVREKWLEHKLNVAVWVMSSVEGRLAKGETVELLEAVKEALSAIEGDIVKINFKI